MKNSFGQSLIVTLFGESHGPAVGAVLDGLAPGIPVDESFIAEQLRRRRPSGSTGSARREEDRFSILSGVFEGRTTGTPLSITIPNEDRDSRPYEELRGAVRPGHADYTAYVRYHGFEDPRGGGHFSGRVTATLVAAGAVVTPALRRHGIRIGTHLARCGGISDRSFDDPDRDLDLLAGADFAVLDPEAGQRMKARIEEAAADGDSVGGVLETAVTGLPAGVGEPWFDTVEGVLAHGLFSIPAVKGVQFGAAFDEADAPGSRFNDAYSIKDGRIITETNHNGGVAGGLTNGMPVLFRCMVKPTPSIAKEQKTVNVLSGKETTISVRGRHDPAVVHRAAPVVDAVTALILADLLTVRFGTDYLGEGKV